MIRPLWYLWYHKSAILLAVSMVIVWKILGHVLSSYTAVIGPEFLTRAVIKTFGIAMAIFITFHCDRWVAPVLSDWCDLRFKETWNGDPSDPRLKICVFFYTAVFVGLSLVFAL